MENEIKIFIAQAEHRDGIVRLFGTTMNQYEPISAALKLPWDQAKEGCEKLAYLATQKPYSHIAVNSKNEVIGFRLSRILEMDKLIPSDSIYEFLNGILKTLTDNVSKNWPTVLPRTGKVLQFLALCVHQDYGGHGIALKMTNANLALGKELGCKVATVGASNWMSQSVFEKAAFQIVDMVYYKDCKDESGNPLLNIEDPKQKGIKFYVRKLD